MTHEEIKANAPDGATHYSLRTETYYKQDDDGLYHWCDQWLFSWYKDIHSMRHIMPL